MNLVKGLEKVVMLQLDTSREDIKMIEKRLQMLQKAFGKQRKVTIAYEHDSDQGSKCIRGGGYATYNKLLRVELPLKRERDQRLAALEAERLRVHEQELERLQADRRREREERREAERMKVRQEELERLEIDRLRKLKERWQAEQIKARQEKLEKSKMNQPRMIRENHKKQRKFFREKYPELWAR
jgi:hypothetical protein